MAHAFVSLLCIVAVALLAPLLSCLTRASFGDVAS